MAACSKPGDKYGVPRTALEQALFKTYPLRTLPRLFILAVLINFGYPQFISLARIAAAPEFLMGRKGWHRVPRKGLAEIGEA